MSTLKCCFLFIVFLFSLSLNASPCSPDVIKKALTDMKLDPFVYINEELMESVQFQYGQEMLSYLISLHPPIIQDPKGKIDSNTIFWVKEMLWSEKNIHAPLLYVPNDLSSKGSLDIFLMMMHGALLSEMKMVPLFQFKESADLYLALLEPDKEQYVKELFIKIYPNASEDTAIDQATNFLHHFRRHKEFKIGFDFPSDYTPTVHIAGHSHAGFLSFGFGDKFVSTEEIVLSLLEMGLPSNTDIHLMGCFSGCSSNKLSITVAEVEDLFIKGRLLDIFEGNSVEGSFLESFYFKLREKYPLYTGTVHGYIGQIVNTVLSGVLTRENQRVRAFPVHIHVLNPSGIGKTVVRLKREHARMSINSKDGFHMAPYL